MRFYDVSEVPEKSVFTRLFCVFATCVLANFQDRLVVTASIFLHIYNARCRIKLACKRRVRVSSAKPKYSYNNAKLCYYSSIKFLQDILTNSAYKTVRE